MLENVNAKKDELELLSEEVSKVWFEMGRALYEKELAEKKISEFSIKAHNLNLKALELQKKKAKEDAALKVKLAGETNETFI